MGRTPGQTPTRENYNQVWPPRDEPPPPTDPYPPHQGGGEEGVAVWEEDGWVWDEREQAWRTRRADGSWEWEWEYEGREQGVAGRGSPVRDYRPHVDEGGRELPRYAS